MTRANEREGLETLRAFGVSGDDAALLSLLKGSDFNIERAINHYFDAGPPRVTSAAPPPQQRARTSISLSRPPPPSSSSTTAPAASRAADVDVYDMTLDEGSSRSGPSSPAAHTSASAEDGGSPPAHALQKQRKDSQKRVTAGGAQQMCKHGKGPECQRCAAQVKPTRVDNDSNSSSSHSSDCASAVNGNARSEGGGGKGVGGGGPGSDDLWPKVLGERPVYEAYSISRASRGIKAREAVHVTLEASTRTMEAGLKTSGGGRGANLKRKAQQVGENRRAAAVRFRTESGVEGRLPAEVGAVLMPLLAKGLVVLDARTILPVGNVDFFTRIPVRLRVSVNKSFFDAGGAEDEKKPQKPSQQTAAAQRSGGGGSKPKAKGLLGLLGVKQDGTSSGSGGGGGSGGAGGAEGKGAENLPVREAVMSLIAYLETGKAEVLSDEQESKRQRMMGAAGTQNAGSASGGGGGGGGKAASVGGGGAGRGRRKGGGGGDETTQAAGDAEEAAGDGDGNDGDEDEEGVKVDESQVERLYRLNEEYYRSLPKFEGDVAGLRGLELRPYQRQALAWMLKREEDHSATPAANDTTTQELISGRGGDDGGEGEERGLKTSGMHLHLGQLHHHRQQQQQRQQHTEAAMDVGVSDDGNSTEPPTPAYGAAAWLDGVGLVQVSDAIAKDQPAHHPLWTRHFVAPVVGPSGSADLGQPLAFYANIYSRRVQVEVPPPPNECRGGILGDDMGMGKTVMLLSLILEARNRQQRANNGAPAKGGGKAQPKCTLVVVPLSLISQWKKEIEAYTAPNTLSIAFYYGPDRVTSSDFLRNMDVVLTTYGTLSSEFQSHSSTLSSGNTPRSGLYSVRWARLILDEAHSIKNRGTAQAKAAYAVDAVCRWASTGTPIQNALRDLYALLRFLRHEPWDDPVWWKKVIEEPFASPEDNEGALDRLRSVLAPILLRRTKSSRDEHGRPIVELPERDVQLVEVEFSEAERSFYESLRDRSRLEFEGFVASGTAMQAYAQILVLLLRLRQACDHPFLVLGRATMEKSGSALPSSQQPPLSLAKSASSSATATVNGYGGVGDAGPAAGGPMKPTAATGRKSSVTPDFIQDLFLRFTRQQHGTNNGTLTASASTHSTTRNPQSADEAAPTSVAGVRDEGVNGVRGLSSPAPGSSIEAAAAVEVDDDEASASLEPSRAYFDHVVKQLQVGSASASECPICLCSVEDPVVTPCCHIMCRSCLRDALDYPTIAATSAARPEAECPVCRRAIAEADIVHITDQATGLASPQKSTSTHTDEAQEDPEAPGDAPIGGDGPSPEAHTCDVAVLGGEGVVGKGRVGGLGRMGGGGLMSKLSSEDVIRGSAKLRRLVEELDRLLFSSAASGAAGDSNVEVKEGEVGGEGDEPNVRKAVVFSQWTDMLDLCATALDGKRWRYARLDGSMAERDRERALSLFATDKDVRVFLMSLKAGGVGLNLTTASVVCLLDPWWNPAVEDQAIDRVHRLGQRAKTVTVLRMVVKETVESQMLEIQEKKRHVAQNALAMAVDRDKEAEGKLNLDELRRFFT